MSRKSKLLRRLADYLSDISKLALAGIILVNLPIFDGSYFEVGLAVFAIIIGIVVIIEFILLREGGDDE